jgi:hypothetical protein
VTHHAADRPVLVLDILGIVDVERIGCTIVGTLVARYDVTPAYIVVA